MLNINCKFYNFVIFFQLCYFTVRKNKKSVREIDGKEKEIIEFFDLIKLFYFHLFLSLVFVGKNNWF